MEVGFNVQTRNEQVEIQLFGRHADDPHSLVVHARHGRRQAVMLGNLTYRSELVKQLQPETIDAGLANDAALGLAAYRQWGPAGLARLEGCFSLVIWDGDGQLLLGSRDPLGGYPLFWTKHADGLAFATCHRPLLQLLPRRCLDLNYLAEFLAVPFYGYQEVPTQHSVYQGIHRVGLGSIVQARPANGVVQEQRYWNWRERMVDPGTDRLEELGELVAHGLGRAVGENLRGCVASHVSGGMDSTSVALLARDWLRCQPGQPPVHAISAVFDPVGGLSREAPYLECALEQPGLVSHRVPAGDLLDYDCFADPPMHDEPLGALDRFGLQEKLIQVAAEIGANTPLSGHGADAMLDQRPYHLAGLIRRGRLWSAWREARSLGRATNTAAWHYLWNFGMVPWLPAASRGGLGALLHGGHAEWHRQGPGTIAPWIRPGFVRANELRERALRHLRLPSGSVMDAMLSTLPSITGDGGARWYAAAPRGLTHGHPFLDSRFICLCLGIHNRYRQQPVQQKPLLGYAMRDVLPESIRKRRSKGHYTAVYYAGLARNLPVLENLVREAPDDPGAFDKDVLLRCLQQAALGFAPGAAVEKLKLTLAWLLWHSRQNEWQRPMTPAAIVREGIVERTAANHSCGSSA